MRIGWVVLTYNRPAAALAVLRALAPQCSPQDVVVVADDGSRPENVQALRAGMARLPCRGWHVWHPDVGFTAARSRNLGARQSGCDYIVFLDGDCVPNPHFARAHRALARPRAFVNGSRVLLSESLTKDVESGAVQPLAQPLSRWLRLRMDGHVNKLTHLLSWTGAPGRVQSGFEWKGIRSCNFGLAWADFEAVNGFDETFSGWGHEDADLVLRLHHQGLARVNGWLGTEVLHLWHPEASRAGEQANRRRVEERQRGGITRAERGLAQSGEGAPPVVTELEG